MSKSPTLQRVLGKAREKEKKCNWIGAVKSYEKALEITSKQDNLLKAANVKQRIGLCLFNAAMQAKDQEEFKRTMQQAITAYENAGRAFEKITDEQKEARANQCKAMASYSRFWLEPEGSLKKKLLDKGLDLERKTISAYEGADVQPSLAKACNDIVILLHERLQLESDKQEIDKIIQESERFCTKAFEVAHTVKQELEIARAYYNLGRHYRLSVFHRQLSETSENKRKEAIGYLEKAIETFRKIDNPRLLALASLELGFVEHVRITSDVKKGLPYFREVLKQILVTEDNYIIAWTFYGFGNLTWWHLMLAENPEEKRAWYKESVKYSEKSVDHANRIMCDSGVAMGYHWRSYSDFALGLFVETNPQKTRSLLENSVEVARKSLEHGERCGYPVALSWSLHVLSNALAVLSEVETDVDKRRSLLEQALKYGKECRDTADVAFPHDYWNVAVFDWILARVKAGLAEIEADKETKVRIFEEASHLNEESLSLALMYQKLYPDPKRFMAGAEMYLFHGTILNRLYTLSRRESILRQLLDAFEGAARMFAAIELNSRVAEAQWQAARVYDLLGQHDVSARNFLSASEEYKKAAKKIPSLESFFLDYAIYMQAWSEVVEGRHDHRREDYSLSSQHYRKAADLLQSSKSWSYLSSNFLAWSTVEHAEDLSRKENLQESIDCFSEAEKLFAETKLSLESETGRLQFKDERDQATKIAGISNFMKEYCTGRVLLDQAKINAEKGQCMESAQKYDAAAQVFDKITKFPEIETEQEELAERVELVNMILLCKAWEKMELAEENVSPELYAEAAQLFAEAQEASPKKSLRLLAAGNASFCRALSAGTEFETTRDMNLYSAAKAQMASAASYYLRAGFDKASTWVNATEMLFDAYVYMGKAETAVDPEDKATFYRLTEKHLERSADLYETAGYTGKGHEALRMLTDVKRKSEFVLSLVDVLEAPSIASSSTLISTPSQAHEVAMGLERFDHAEVQVSLTAARREVFVGEHFDLEVEMVNAGRGSAFLMKAEKIVPEGIELKEKPETFRIEGHNLNMKRERLDPLKTVELKLVFEALSKGVFSVNPRILYLDETGKCKYHEPSPVTITVKELGISRWIRGEK